MKNDSEGKPSISAVDRSSVSEPRSMVLHLRKDTGCDTAKFNHSWASVQNIQAYDGDSTSLTRGSCPACKTMTEEVALFVLTAHCTFGITRWRRALIWDILKWEKQKQTEIIFYWLLLKNQVWASWMPALNVTLDHTRQRKGITSVLHIKSWV